MFRYTALNDTHLFTSFVKNTSVLCVWKKSWDDYTTVCGCAVNLNAWILCELGDQNVAILERKRMQDFMLSSLWMSHELWKYCKQLTQVELKPLFKHDCMREFWRICKVEKNSNVQWLALLAWSPAECHWIFLVFVCAVSVHRPMLHDHILFDCFKLDLLQAFELFLCSV